MSSIICNLTVVTYELIVPFVKESTGGPRLVWFQLVQFPVNCDLKMTLNSAIPQYSAIYKHFTKAGNDYMYALIEPTQI